MCIRDRYEVNATVTKVGKDFVTAVQNLSLIHICMLMHLSDQAEIIIVISAKDIEKNKVRGDLGITYDTDVLRLMDSFRQNGLYVGSVVITQYSGQESALLFKNRLENLGIKVYIQMCIRDSLYIIQYGM